MSRWDGTCPFNDDTGELLSYDGDYRARGNVTRKTKDEARFTGELTYLKYSRGRSSALLVFTDGTQVKWVEHLPAEPRQFPFFMTHADEIIPLLVKGKIKGTFVPTKMGTNYGWMLEKPSETKAKKK